MPQLKVMHPSKGDAVMTWDRADAASETRAREAFTTLISTSHLAIVKDGDGEDVFTKDWDPDQELIELIPRLVGG